MAFKRPSVQFCPAPPEISRGYDIIVVTPFFADGHSHVIPDIFLPKRNGDIPVQTYLASMRDCIGKVQIARRIQRAALGNLGDHHALGNGLHEMRIDSGPGYRRYYSYHNSIVLVLLLAGDKSEQTADINKAKNYLEDFKSKKTNEKSASSGSNSL